MMKRQVNGMITRVFSIAVTVYVTQKPLILGTLSCTKDTCRAGGA